MAKKNVDELISMAQAATKQAADTGIAADSSQELMDAIQSAAAKLKRAAGADSELAALVDQVQALAKQSENK